MPATGAQVRSASPVRGPAARLNLVGGRLAALPSASDPEVAPREDSARHGPCNHRLADAQCGEGDADGGGRVSGSEVKRYSGAAVTLAARWPNRRCQRANLI